MKQLFHFTRATTAEAETLLTLMREFYAHEHLTFDAAGARTAVSEILNNPAFGFIYLAQQGELVIGYFVVTLCFSLEFHGRYALLDELYVRQSHQRLGVGRGALKLIEELSRREGVHAIRLEVDWNNSAAQNLYRRAGFTEHDRHLMTKRL